MSKKERKKGGKNKDSQLIVRINREERDAFIQLCEELDTSAAREVRRFIRDFLKEHANPPAPEQPSDAGRESSAAG
jgi:hypothetical protein